ncbi:SCO family protein [uncultured Abyssibacter sp.]|uniref:SCO family protein n=1 Tax=uncultured Abyssibacter sp. TaxID=2320202 RepID=UPI0032B145D2
MRWLAMAPLLAVFMTASAAGNVAEQNAALDGARFEQRIGESVPTGLRFTDVRGHVVALDALHDGRPLVLVMSWFNCPNLCPLVLDGLAVAAASVPFRAGEDYAVAAVGIAPDEGPDAALAMQSRLGTDTSHWYLLSGSKPQIDRLAQAVGFHYAYDAEQDRYAHPSGLVVIAPDGRISRYLFGLNPAPDDLERALIDAGDGRLGSVAQQVVLRCFRYNAATGQYSLAIWQLLRVAAAVVALLLMVLVWRLHRRSRRGMAHG